MALLQALVGVGRPLEREGLLDVDRQAPLVGHPSQLGELGGVGADEDVAAAGPLVHGGIEDGGDPPAVAHQPDALLERVAAAGVEEGVQAVGMGRAQLAHPVTVVVQDELGAQLVDEVVVGRAGGSDHAGPQVARDLHGEVADAARGGGDQHGLARPQLQRLGERLVGGQAGEGEGGGGREVQGGGSGRHEGVGQGRDLRVGALLQPVLAGVGHHLVAHRHPARGGSDPLHDSRQVPAEHHREVAGEARLLAPFAGLDVDRVDPRRVDAHQHAVRSHLRLGQLAQPQLVPSAEFVDRHCAHAASSRRSLAHGIVTQGARRRLARRERRYRRRPHGRPRRPAPALRLRALSPRPGRGGGRRAGGSRRPGGDAHGVGKVALLPAPGAHARGPHAGRLAARVAHPGPGGEPAARWPASRWRWPAPRRTPAANRAAVERAAAGELRLLYVAPERLASPGFIAALERAPIGLFVVDEAHCVSQWGHDFRPDYFRLADAARYLGAEAILASTATATPQVAADIVRRLGLREPVRVVTGFDRPNLSFAVSRCRGRPDKRRRLADGAARPRRAARHRLRGHAGRLRGAGAVAEGGAGRARGGLPRRPAARDPVRHPAALHGRRDPRRGRHQRVRHGPRQARRAHGPPRDGAPRRWRRSTRRPAAPAATAPRRAACCWPRGATRACTCSSSSAPRWTTPPSPGSPSACAWAGVDGRYDIGVRDLARAAGCEEEDVARDHRPPGPGRGAPALARGDGPRHRAPAGALRRPGAGGLPRLRGRGPARALAPVPGDLGLRGGRRLPARDDPAPLRRPRRRRALGRLLRRVRPRPGGGRRRARAGRAARAARRAGRRDHRRGPHRPPLGGPDADRGDPAGRALGGAAAQRLRRPARLRRLRPPGRRRRPGAGGRAPRRRAAALDGRRLSQAARGEVVVAR